MNTPTIAAVLTASPPPASRGSQPNSDEDLATNPRFSDVLTDQQVSRTPTQPQNTVTTHSGSTNAESDAKPSAKATNNEKETQDLSDAAALVSASEQGLTLPQIALDMAAHVIASATTTDNKTLEASTGDKTSSNLTLSNDLNTASADKAQTAFSVADNLTINTVQDKVSLTPSPDMQHQTQLDTKKSVDTTNKTKSPNALNLASNARHANNDASLASSKLALINTSTGEKAAINQTLFLDRANDVTTLNATTTSFDTLAGHNAALNAPAIATTTAPNTTSLAIASNLQSPQWSSDFGRQIVTLTQTGQNQSYTAELRLDPPELGPIRISISISDSTAHAVFVSPHAAVRHAVENALPELQQQLAQAGISLGQTSVNDQGQSQGTFDQPTGHNRQALNPSGPTMQTDANIATAPITTRTNAALNALVDTFA